MELTHSFLPFSRLSTTSIRHLPWIRCWALRVRGPYSPVRGQEWVQKSEEATDVWCGNTLSFWIFRPEYFLRNNRTGTPHFAVHPLITLHRCFSFYKLKVCGDPASSKTPGTLSPIAFSHFGSLCQNFGNSCNISNVFIIINIIIIPWINGLWCFYNKNITTHWSLRRWLAFVSI